MSFADAEYAGKRKQTRRERFLIEMDQVVPWTGLLGLIEPFYPKAGGGKNSIINHWLSGAGIGSSTALRCGADIVFVFRNSRIPEPSVMS